MAKLFRPLYADLTKKLDPAELVPVFFAENLLTSAEKEQIEAETIRSEKNVKLLDALMRRDEDKALKVLIKTLKENEELNSILLGKIREKHPSYFQEDEGGIQQTDQPQPKPKETPVVHVEVPSLPRFEMIPRGTVPTKEPVVQSIQTVYPSGESTDGPMPDRYPIHSMPRGYCVIINNIKFKTMKDRLGSDWDAENLEKLFKRHLGFFVERFDDLTSLQMRQLMDNVRKQDHSKLSCLVVAILTHGIEGQVYGTDGGLSKIEDLTAYFDGTQCPTLIGKPKIFILQACRGGNFDDGVEATDDATAQEREEDYEEIDGRYTLLPDKADFVLAYATAPQYVSWRNSAFGTWFIKAFTETMYERARTDHFMDILTEVNRKVAEDYESRGKNKQMPAPVNMLRYKLFLPPV